MFPPLRSSARQQENSRTSTGSAKYWALVSAGKRLSKIGAFGEVRMVVHRESGAQRAVKVLKKSGMDEDSKRMLFNEINILREIVSQLKTNPTTGPPEHREDVRVFRGHKTLLPCYRVRELNNQRLLDFARAVSSSTRSYSAENSAKRTLLYWWSRCSRASTTATRTTSCIGKTTFSLS